jgi:hypothetical protein
MTNEEMKLQCYAMAGNLADAIKLYQWLSEDAGLREVRAYTSGSADGYQMAMATLRAAEPVSEPEPEPSLFDAEPSDEEDASSDDEDDAPTEIISDLTGDPAIEPESGLHGEPEPTELDAPASIVDDPELQAAVARAEATLQEAEPAYVGLQDPDLDAEYDAMREREKADKPKLHFSIFGERGNRKLENVE